MEISVNRDEFIASFREALASDPDLLAEVDRLFFEAEAPYKIADAPRYVFTIAIVGENIGVRRRDEDERAAMLRNPEAHGLSPRER